VTKTKPCLPGGPDGTCCVAGLLFGAACCRTGDCALCEDVTARLRRDGHEEDQISARLVSTWYSPIESCPLCGAPAPRLEELLPLPRFLRRYAGGHVSSTCFVCGGHMPAGKRRFCSPTCHTEYRRGAEGWGFGRFQPVPRVYRVH